jgi:outer membrane protein W
MKQMTLAPAVLVLLLATAVHAQTDGFVRSLYVEPSIGICWVDQASGHTQPADTGYHLGLVGGWRFHRRWAVELHTGRIHNEVPATGTREADSVTQVPLVANLAFHFPNSSRFEPYLSGGFGVVFATNKGDSGGDGLLEFAVGVRHTLNEQLELGLSYRFFMMVVNSAFAEEAVGDDTLNLARKIAL